MSIFFINVKRIYEHVVFLAHYPKIYQIQQHPQTGVTAVAVAAPQGSYIQQQGVTPEQASLTASEAQQQQ